MITTTSLFKQGGSNKCGDVGTGADLETRVPGKVWSVLGSFFSECGVGCGTYASEGEIEPFLHRFPPDEVTLGEEVALFFLWFCLGSVDLWERDDHGKYLCTFLQKHCFSPQNYYDGNGIENVLQEEKKKALIAKRLSCENGGFNLEIETTFQV